MFYSFMLHVDLLFATMFQKKKVKCIKIDGKTRLTTRQTLVTDFQENDDIKAAVVCFTYSYSTQKYFNVNTKDTRPIN